MSEKGVLRGIAIRPGHGVPMRELESVRIATDSGLEGDYARRRGKRQVTVLTQEAWAAACAEAGADLHWTARRANLLVDGVALAESTGARLQIDGVLLEITGETDPCSNMDAAHMGLRAALEPDWRGGVTCRVLQGGTVRIDDAVSLTE